MDQVVQPQWDRELKEIGSNRLFSLPHLQAVLSTELDTHKRSLHENKLFSMADQP